ncbi:MAG TPA: BatA domain-containing protein [Vicinamibacterales bacterium]
MWRHPLALLALVTVAAPILIHILVQRRAQRFAFPTLRFIAPTRLAAIRRHLLEDAALLAVRIAILIAAIVALAGPLIVTAARRRAWNQQVVRAVVSDATAPIGMEPAPPDTRSNVGAELAPPGTTPAVGAELAPPDGVDRTHRLSVNAEKTFDATTLTDGIRRALAWLDTAPPGRRELVIRSSFPIGSLTDSDVAAIPPGVGIVFERRGVLPLTRTVTIGTVLTADGSRSQSVTLDGARTLVKDASAARNAEWPIEISSPPSDRSALDAAVAAVRAERVWAPSADRRARLVIVDRAESMPPALAAAGAIQQAWMAEVIVRVAGDPDLQAAAVHAAAGLNDPRLASAPWQTLAVAADGRPLILAAASSAQLVVVSAAGAKELITPLLLRTVANAIAQPADLQQAEVTPIPEQVLPAWSREAGPAEPPRIDTIVDDDRRWFWLTGLVLLAIEMWMQRSRTSVAIQAEEQSRVA